jgi:ubiquinone biosynthesis protein
VRARIHRDARLMLWLAHVAYALSPRARAADVIGHARSLVAGIIMQADLAREADNLERFRADFAGTPGLAFPRVLRALCRPSILTMSLVRGVHLEHVPREHVEQVTRTLRDAFFAMCFEHGLVHADLHPGNILVGPDATVFILDVGLVKYLDAAAIARIVELAGALVLGTPAELVAHLRDHHPHGPTTDWDALAADAETLITRLRRARIADVEVAQLVSALFALARKHGIHPLPELSLVLLGIVTIEGIAKRLDPDANTLAEIARYLAPRIAHTRLARGSREWSHPPLGARTECDAPPTTPPSLRTSPSDPHTSSGTRDAPTPVMARRSE